MKGRTDLRRDYCSCNELLTISYEFLFFIIFKFNLVSLLLLAAKGPKSWLKSLVLKNHSLYLYLFALEDWTNAGVKGSSRKHWSNRVGQIQDLLKIRRHILWEVKQGQNPDIKPFCNNDNKYFRSFSYLQCNVNTPWPTHGPGPLFDCYFFPQRIALPLRSRWRCLPPCR